MTRYPVVLTRDREAGGFVVTFPDFPEAFTQGDDVEDALGRAAGALETAIMIYIAQPRDLPPPGRIRKYSVGLPALSDAKVALFKAMRAAGIRKAGLARRLGWRATQVDRLLDLTHASRLDRIERALGALRKRLVVDVQDAA